MGTGQSTPLTVKFAPTITGSASGNVTITSNASNTTLTIPISGTGLAAGVLSAAPSSLNFGNVTFSTAISTPMTLAAGQSVVVNVKFAPTTSGSASGTVTVTSNGSNPTLTIPLSGTGAAAAGQLAINPTTLALGSIEDGTSGTASGSLIATGANVTVTAASTNNSVFSLGGLSLPVTIAAGTSLPFTITFSPQTIGSVSATLTITSNAQPSTTTATLTGTGTAAPSHTVNLSWNASTSSNVSGYNIYRAVYTTSCGSYVKINSLLNTTTLYTDASVVNGISYCYAATAVDTSSQESGYSNIASNVQIPTF